MKTRLVLREILNRQTDKQTPDKPNVIGNSTATR